jgi:hypothetical protein
MDAAEEELRSSLVIFVGGTRSMILPEQVTGHLNRHLGITAEEALIRRYKVSSFLISFIDMRLVDRVLHSPPPVGAEVVLVFACYCRQTGALFSSLRFKVLLTLENIPVHAWSRETVHAVVNCSCLIFDTAPGLVDGSNLSSYWAAAWCVHPDLIPTEVRCIFPEPEEIIEDRASLPPPRCSFRRLISSTPRGIPFSTKFSLRLWKSMISRRCLILTLTAATIALPMTPSAMACWAQS